MNTALRFVSRVGVPVGPTNEYAVPNIDGTKALIKCITLCNTSGVQVNAVTVKLAGVAICSFPLAANDTKVIDLNTTLEKGEIISSAAGTGGVVDLTVSGMLVTA